MHDAGPKGRRVFHGCNDGQDTVAHANDNAQPAEFTLCAGLQFLETFRIQIGGVGVEAAQHAVDRFGHEFLVAYRFYIIALDASEHLGKGAHFLERQGRLGVLVRDGGKVQADQQPG